MTIKKVKDLFDVTTASEFKKNEISSDFSIEYTTKNASITYLSEKNIIKNLNGLRNFLKKNNISNLRLTKKAKTILIEEKGRFNPADIEKKSEKGSVWIFNRALIDDKVYHSINDIKNDKKFKELEEIFDGNVGDQWLESFYKQQKRLLEEFGKPYWGKFEYDENDNLMEFIKDVLSQVSLDGKKVQYKNWNPSDIWMIKDGSKQKIKDFIRKNIPKNSRSQTLEEFNSLLSTLIKNKELIGVSLKKVGRGDAKFIYVNIDITTKDIADYFVDDIKKVKEVSLDLSLDSTNNFKDQQAKVEIEKGKNIQIKPQTPNRESNLAFEVLITGSGGRGGKAPVDRVLDLLNTTNFKNNFNNYPKDFNQFLGEKNEYVEMYDFISNKNVKTNVKNSDEFIENMRKAFNSGDNKISRIATYKLMELKFLYYSFKSKDNTTELWTDIYYLGLKVGKNFAPHAKLY